MKNYTSTEVEAKLSETKTKEPLPTQTSLRWAPYIIVPGNSHFFAGEIEGKCLCEEKKKKKRCITVYENSIRMTEMQLCNNFQMIITLQRTNTFCYFVELSH